MSNRFDPEELDSALQNEFAAASASITPSEELLEKMNELGEPTKKRKSSRKGKSRVIFSAAAAFLFLVAGAGFWIATQRDDSTETAQEQQEGEAQSNQEAEDAALQVKVDEKVAQFEECLGPIDWKSIANFPNYFYLFNQGHVEILTGEASEVHMGTDAGSYGSVVGVVSEEETKFEECSDLGQDDEEMSSLYEKFDADIYMESEEYLQYRAAGKKLLEQCLLDSGNAVMGANGPEDELLSRLLEEIEPGLADKMRNESGVLQADEIAKKFADQELTAVAKEKKTALEQLRNGFTEEARCMNKDLLLHLVDESEVSGRFVRNQDISSETKSAYIARDRTFQILVEEAPTFFDDHVVQSEKKASEFPSADLTIWFEASDDQESVEDAREKLEEKLKVDSSVRSYKYIDQEETIAEIEQYFSNKPDMLELITESDVPTSMMVEFASEAVEIPQQEIDDFVEEYEQLPGVESISVIPEKQDQGLAERVRDSLQR